MRRALMDSITSHVDDRGRLPGAVQPGHDPLLGDRQPVLGQVAEVLLAAEAGDRVAEPGR